MSQPILPFRDGPFSLLAPCRFTVAGTEYHSLEHHLVENARTLLRLTRPSDEHRVADTVADTDPELWDEHSRDLLDEGVLARFSQDETARAALLATAGQQLAYADPADHVWGTGLDLEATANAAIWPGRNWLGEVLQDVRERLLVRLAAEPSPGPAPASTGERELLVWQANAGDWRAFLALARRRGWLKVLHVSDEPAASNGAAFLEQAQFADVVLATGDLDDRIEQATCPVFYVFGNHDNPDELASRFLARPEAVLHGGSAVWEGFRLGGVGGCLPYKAHSAGQLMEHEYEKALAGRGTLDIFLTHTPPPFADKDDGIHGCPEAVADYLRRCPPWLHLFGHTHQNVVARVGATTHVGTCGSRWLGVGREGG